MKIKNLFYDFALMACATTMLTSCNGCGNSNNPAAVGNGMCKVICDESFKNILDEEIEVFEYTYKDAKVLPLYMDETAALDSLLHEKVNLIITYRDLTVEQKGILRRQGRAYRSRCIAVDAVALIVNKENDIDFLSMNDIQDIMTGKTTKWGLLFPTKLKDEPIKVIFDQSRSGVLHYMKDKFNNGKDLPIQYYAQGSSKAVFEAVEESRNAIGIIGVSWLTDDMKSMTKTVEERCAELDSITGNNPDVDFTDRIKVLGVRTEDSYKAFKPYQAYIYDGSYPLFRKIFAIDASPLGSHDHDFFTFITGSIGQKIILQTGISPGSVPVRIVNVGE